MELQQPQGYEGGPSHSPISTILLISATWTEVSTSHRRFCPGYDRRQHMADVGAWLRPHPVSISATPSTQESSSRLIASPLENPFDHPTFELWQVTRPSLEQAPAPGHWQYLGKPVDCSTGPTPLHPLPVQTGEQVRGDEPRGRRSNETSDRSLCVEGLNTGRTHRSRAGWSGSGLASVPLSGTLTDQVCTCPREEPLPAATATAPTGEVLEAIGPAAGQRPK